MKTQGFTVSGEVLDELIKHESSKIYAEERYGSPTLKYSLRNHSLDIHITAFVESELDDNDNVTITESNYRCTVECDSSEENTKPDNALYVYGRLAKEYKPLTTKVLETHVRDALFPNGSKGKERLAKTLDEINQMVEFLKSSKDDIQPMVDIYLSFMTESKLMEKVIGEHAERIGAAIAAAMKS